MQLVRPPGPHETECSAATGVAPWSCPSPGQASTKANRSACQNGMTETKSTLAHHAQSRPHACRHVHCQKCVTPASNYCCSSRIGCGDISANSTGSHGVPQTQVLTDAEPVRALLDLEVQDEAEAAARQTATARQTAFCHGPQGQRQTVEAPAMRHQPHGKSGPSLDMR